MCTYKYVHVNQFASSMLSHLQWNRLHTLNPEGAEIIHLARATEENSQKRLHAKCLAQRPGSIVTAMISQRKSSTIGARKIL